MDTQCDPTTSRAAPTTRGHFGHCPRCDSPEPRLHPAMQFEGEVQVCPDPYHTPICHVCGKAATCIGSYEGHDADTPQPACDDCCGHGNEDGWCAPLPLRLERASK